MSHTKVILLIFLFIGISLGADEIKHSKGLQFYEDSNYVEAFKIFLEEANAGHKASQYRVAYMYETGLGISVDQKKSVYWYKQASSQYANSIKKTGNNEYSFWGRLRNTFGRENYELGNEYLYTKLGTTTPESRQAVQRFTDTGTFGLQAYQTNFILPLSIAQERPQYYYSVAPVRFSPETQAATYDKKIEVEYQLSLKKQLTYDLFGWDEFIYAAYTQKVWWQLYSASGPFRETNYLPEIYMTVPTSKGVDEAIGLKFLKFGFLHESNGQDGFRSRSWNRLYLTGQWQWDNFFLSTRAWYRIPEKRKSDLYYNGDLFDVNDNLQVVPNEEGDDNPDIQDYLGYGDIKIDYLYNQHQFGLLLRNNLRFNNSLKDNKGAVEFNWSHPILRSESIFYYVKLFHGYGENLITYDTKTTKTSFGISISRGLFQ